MGLNKEFYKRVGFVFIGIIAVLIVARYTLFSTAPTPSPTPSGSFSYKKADKVINWKDADKYIGRYITVEGGVVRTYNSGKACFLNFHSDYRRYFTAVIFGSDFNKFPKNPEEYYKGKKVQVTGTIKEYQGSPEIILNSPSQIKVLYPKSEVRSQKTEDREQRANDE